MYLTDAYSLNAGQIHPESENSMNETITKGEGGMKASTRSKKADAADVGSVFSPESPAAGIDSRRGVKDAMEGVMKGVSSSAASSR